APGRRGGGPAPSTGPRTPRPASAPAADSPANPPPMPTTSAMSRRKLRPPPGREREADLLVAGQRDALAEDVEAARLDAREEPLVDQAHGLRRRERAPVLGRERAARAQVVGARPAALERHERRHARPIPPRP